MGGSTASEVDMLKALDVALECIFLDNLIEDRHTLLTGRLVCRTWRRLKTFTGKITSVTLHTLADVQLAADLFPLAPLRHAPWRRDEDCQAFPYLETLKVSEGLKYQLYECSLSRNLLGTLLNVHVHIDIGDEDLREGSDLHIFSRFATSLEYTAFGHDNVKNSFFSLEHIDAFYRLRKLTVKSMHTSGKAFVYHGVRARSVSVPAIQSLATFLQFIGLQDLRLENVTLCNETELGDCLATLASLTQLTRLDILGDIHDPLRGTLEGLSLLLKDRVPKALHELRFALVVKEQGYEYEEEEEEEAGCILQASYNRGVLKIEQCKSTLWIEQPEDLGNEISWALSEDSNHNPRSETLVINIYCELPDPIFPMDLTEMTAVQQFAAAITAESLKETSTFYNVFTEESSAVKSPPTRFVRPILKTQNGMQMAASELKFETSYLGALDLSIMAADLPVLFPNLRTLTLGATGGAFEYPNSFSQLTNLTQLKIDIKCPWSIDLPFVPAVFPPSLRELDIDSFCIDLSELSGLEQLTKLSLRVNGESDNTVGTLYSCRAPLKDLLLEGLPVDLFALAKAFPHLEVLSLNLAPFDMSPVSNLQSLRQLTLYLPDTSTCTLSGIGSLTHLASLYIWNAVRSFEGLRDLAQLTQLRHLGVFMWSQKEGGRDNMPRAMLRQFHQLRKRLQYRMPYTGLLVSVNCVDSHDFEKLTDLLFLPM